jgi:protein phosphatase
VGFAYATRAAKGARNYQEDTAEVRTDGAGVVAVLADGMGGHVGGALASGLACKFFLHGFATASGEVQVRLGEALALANAAIAAGTAENPDLRGMGCTLVGLALRPDPDRLEWISVGDSPLYLVRNGRIERLNEDHSLAPEIDRLAEAGGIGLAEAKAHPSRHVLRSALVGTEIEMIDRSRQPLALQPGDVVVLASDGIHTVSEADIARAAAAAAATPDAAAEALLAAVEAAGEVYQDNTTVVVVRVAGP